MRLMHSLRVWSWVILLFTFFEPIGIRQVDNQRIEARALLCFENLCYCDRIECVSSEAVNCFCRQADDFARMQKRYRLRALEGGNDFRFHFGTR